MCEVGVLIRNLSTNFIRMSYTVSLVFSFLMVANGMFSKNFLVMLKSALESITSTTSRMWWVISPAPWSCGLIAAMMTAPSGRLYPPPKDFSRSKRRIPLNTLVELRFSSSKKIRYFHSSFSYFLIASSASLPLNLCFKYSMWSRSASLTSLLIWWKRFGSENCVSICFLSPDFGNGRPTTSSGFRLEQSM